MVRRVPGLHLITDDRVITRSGFVSTTSEILQQLPQQLALHLRARTIPASQLYDLASALCALDPTPDVFINDRIDIAAAVGAAGVQLGARTLSVAHARAILGPGPAIGYSAHAADEAAAAEADGANFVLLGTIYRSASHPDRKPAGPELIAETVKRCTIPIIAIGGITLQRVREVQAAGASGVAVISAVWHAPDPVQAAREFAKLL